MEDTNLNEVLTVKSSTKIAKLDVQSDIKPIKLKVYKRRWLMLAIYMLYNSTMASQWIEYAIIANIVSRYYRISTLMVDWTSMSFMLLYAVFVIPVQYMSDRYGSLRWTALLGSGLSCLGAWIKTFSIHPDSYHIVIIGHSIVAFTQTLILPIPGRLAAQWFPSNELSTATCLGLFGNQVGIAFGFLLTPIIVKNHENLDNVGNDLSRLCWIVAIATTVGFILVILLFQDEPKLPPSETRALQKLNRTKKGEPFVAPIKRLSKNKNYVLLCNSHGLNVGVLNVFATLLNQIYLLHFENGEEDAGRIGLAMIFSGMIGTVVCGIVLDKTHKFKESAIAAYFLTLCGQALFAVFICLGINWMVYVSSFILGFFMWGYLAMGYELCTEYTYPESENMSAGILNITNNIYGVIFVIILGIVLQAYGDIPVHVAFCLILLLGLIITILTEDEQRRQDTKKKAQCERTAKLEDNIDNIPETDQLTHNIN
ncbi:feline leukemia virus subgroup C receptor-related protein 2-like [Nylanderia fulva]|uniref:feline leukemia virus subgroup C receptor-related protein 2-like n=1 Tax=Nylanderia fulva TaxID=613905 RepID=UPI0010FB3EB3|nr:feline leukemia virus subgroup C receptor-related protein 2-like [Nylanderia fulva]XP_029163053.1 feline leukemia virus subgroup C receptor-related protein 2-like [Nylanderia fulva]XP_029163062.1 feline leukemia virus subgroup C receptor-related protein 2-like [Nylanderia fulva]XP_029163069.1 feline leukemia virus subgroup C receptor-related protein 2-like [Nylanderia fulva]